MNADILKRLVRAIAERSQDDLDRLAKKVIETERETGHTKLAGELDRILERARSRSGTHGAPDLRELPSSRRYRELLASMIPRETLEHHMVLPTEVDERFTRIKREFAAQLASTSIAADTD